MGHNRAVDNMKWQLHIIQVYKVSATTRCARTSFEEAWAKVAHKMTLLYEKATVPRAPSALKTLSVVPASGGPKQSPPDTP